MTPGTNLAGAGPPPTAPSPPWLSRPCWQGGREAGGGSPVAPGPLPAPQLATQRRLCCLVPRSPWLGKGTSLATGSLLTRGAFGAPVVSRPVIIVSTSKHLSGDEVSLKKACELATFTIDKAVGQLEAEDSKEWDVDDKGKPVPFKSQTVLCIFDLRGFQNKNGDFGFAKFMVNVFFDLYPKRLSECIFLDSPLMFKPGWAIIKPWLGSYSRLVRFVKSKDVCSEYFTPDTCPDHMK
mmetsp:Transcript_63976/g.202423  ORF Transcript_63976/g.202423 Transcript_63976/m.202423 type:complete len:237 (-) Transcript_63976:149-859(-)